jgi:hypothetical protein
LVRAGQRAICDQLENPKEAKGLLSAVSPNPVTPGVSMHDNVPPSAVRITTSPPHSFRARKPVFPFPISAPASFWPRRARLDYLSCSRISSPAEILFCRRKPRV